MSHVVELMSYVTLSSSCSPASLAALIGKIGDATVAGQRSMIQVGDMSASQLTSPCVLKTVPPGEILPTAGQPNYRKRSLLCARPINYLHRYQIHLLPQTIFTDVHCVFQRLKVTFLISSNKQSNKQSLKNAAGIFCTISSCQKDDDCIMQ